MSNHHNYSITFYFLEDHTYADQLSYHAPKGTPTDVVVNWATQDYADLQIDGKPVYVGCASIRY